MRVRLLGLKQAGSDVSTWLEAQIPFLRALCCRVVDGVVRILGLLLQGFFGGMGSRQ